MGMCEAMGLYVRRFGLAPLGPHRPLADRLLQGATGPCGACVGKGVECAACSGTGHVVRWSQAQIDAARAQVLREFPNAAVPKAQPPDEAPLEAGASLGPSTPQDVIDALVDESRQRTSNTNRLEALGAEFAENGPEFVGDGDMGILLRLGDYAELPDGTEPLSIDDLDDVGVLADYLPSSRYQRIEDGAHLTIDEFLLWRDLTVNQRFEADGHTEAWQIMRIESRDGLSAFVAMTVTGGAREGIEREFVGVFGSFEDAEIAIKELGYTSPEDLRQRVRVAAVGRRT